RSTQQGTLFPYTTLFRSDLAAADAVRRDTGLLGEDAGRQLLGGHFEREEADDRAVFDDQAAVRPARAAIGLCGAEGDVCGERCLPHRRAAGEDDQIGGMQPAEFLVEIDKVRRDADRLAVTLERGF